ncbi:MAG TPA: hypothetical protein VGJ20_01435 [Xanthobacteraceae bacterium]|jgi:hypothetical protein
MADDKKYYHVYRFDKEKDAFVLVLVDSSPPTFETWREAEEYVSQQLNKGNGGGWRIIETLDYIAPAKLKPRD